MSTVMTDGESMQSSLSALFTALFFGLVTGSVLFGVALLEYYRYFKTYRNDDSMGTKISVVIICCLDALHFAFSIHMAHHYLIESFGDPEAIGRAIWSVKALGTIQVVLLWIVQCLYLVRIWILTRNILLHRRIAFPVLCAVIAIAIIGFGSGLAFIIELDQIEYILDFTNLKWVVYLGFGVSAAIDITIAAIMIGLLHKYLTGIKRTDGVISVLIHYFFSTGLLTSLTALIYIILYAAAPRTMLYMGMVFLISRLYTISFLELLNVREQFRDNLDASVGASGIDFGPPLKMQFKQGSTGMTSLTSSFPRDRDGDGGATATSGSRRSFFYPSQIQSHTRSPTLQNEDSNLEAVNV